MTRIVPRYQRVTLMGDYADVWMDVRVNPPMRVFDEFESKDLARIRAALGTLVQASNLEDEDGVPVDLNTPDGWKAVPADLINVVATAITEAISSPKATGATGTTSEPSSATEAAQAPATTP